MVCLLPTPHALLYTLNEALRQVDTIVLPMPMPAPTRQEPHTLSANTVLAVAQQRIQHMFSQDKSRQLHGRATGPMSKYGPPCIRGMPGQPGGRFVSEGSWL